MASSSSSANPSTQHPITLKLTPDNFPLWKAHLFSILRSQELVGFIDGTTVCPPETITSPESTVAIPNPDHAEWSCKDKLVMSLIISSLSLEILPDVVGLDSAAKLWDVLQTTFDTVSRTSVLQLHMQLLNTSKAGKSISEYLSEVKIICDQLAAAGKPIGDTELNAIVFQNLGEDYKDIVAALATKNEPRSFPSLRRALLNHELVLKRVENLSWAKLTQSQHQPGNLQQAFVSQTPTPKLQNPDPIWDFRFGLGLGFTLGVISGMNLAVTFCFPFISSMIKSQTNRGWFKR